MPSPFTAARPGAARFLFVVLWVAALGGAPASARATPGERTAPVDAAPRVAVRPLPEGDVPEADLVTLFAEEARLPGVRFVAAGRPEPPDDPAAAELEERARALELELRFRDAVLVWRELVEQQTAGPTLVLAPRVAARARIALAAAYAEAGEPDLAAVQFREALALDAGFAPGPEYAPHLRALYAQALEAGPALPPTPEDPVLDAAAEAVGARAVLWVAAGREDGRRLLVHRLHFRGEPSQEVRSALPDDPADAAAVVRREAASVRGRLAARLPVAPPPDAADRPWYRSPWLPVGAAAVGAAVVGGVVLAHTLGTERVDVRVRH